MSPVEALKAARTAGIQISIDGDDLVLESTAEPPVAVVDLLTEHKAGILTILRSGEAALSTEDWQACCDERPAIAEFGGPTDHSCHTGIGSAPIIASTNITGSTPTDITGSAPTVALRRPQGDEWSTEDWRAYFDERAAIAEFDGGLPRPEAEARASNCCVAEWLGRNSVYSPSDPCLLCAEADRPNDSLLPIGIAGAGKVLAAHWVLDRLVHGAESPGCCGPGQHEDQRPRGQLDMRLAVAGGLGRTRRRAARHRRLPVAHGKDGTP
jgi:hypothetical protein